LLEEYFKHEKIKAGEIVDFWTEESGGQLKIRDSAESEAQLGRRYLTNNLFGSVWEGNESVMNEVRKKLLVPYMYDTEN